MSQNSPSSMRFIADQRLCYADILPPSEVLLASLSSLSIDRSINQSWFDRHHSRPYRSCQESKSRSSIFSKSWPPLLRQSPIFRWYFLRLSDSKRSHTFTLMYFLASHSWTNFLRLQTFVWNTKWINFLLLLFNFLCVCALLNWKIARNSSNGRVSRGILTEVSCIFLSRSFCARSLMRANAAKAFIRGYLCHIDHFAYFWIKKLMQNSI